MSLHENADFDSDEDMPRLNRKQGKQYSTKPQDFQVRVKVFEARQLDGNNIHPMCRIKCANISKFTKTRRSTNNPYWDEVFFFNFHLSPAEFFDQTIEFQVYNSVSYLKDAMIGCFKLELAYIHDELNHSLLCKWLLLGDAEDCMSGAKGYLKVSISVLGAGDEAPYNVDPSNEDDIER
jgi:hypothetical protein